MNKTVFSFRNISHKHEHIHLHGVKINEFSALIAGYVLLAIALATIIGLIAYICKRQRPTTTSADNITLY